MIETKARGKFSKLIERREFSKSDGTTGTEYKYEFISTRFNPNTGEEYEDAVLNIATSNQQAAADIYPTEESYYTDVLNKFNEYDNGTTGSKNNIE